MARGPLEETTRRAEVLTTCLKGSIAAQCQVDVRGPAFEGFHRQLQYKTTLLKARMELVKWGGDERYREPLTTVHQYTPFCTVTKGSDMVLPPSRELDCDAHSICNKVYALHCFPSP